MATATLSSMDQVLAGLKRQLGGNDLSLGPICTRVMLRTGVNIREPRPDQRENAPLIAKVTTTLAEMGYPI